jgi:hypothetical protein
MTLYNDPEKNFTEHDNTHHDTEHSNNLHKAGNTNWRRKVSMVDLLNMVVCFIKKYIMLVISKAADLN